MISRSFDQETGVVRVKASGPLTVVHVSEHAKALKDLLDDLRLQSIAIRVLVDLRDAGPFGLELESMFRDLKQENYRAGDRVAILTTGADHKQHVRSLLPGGEIWCWNSEFAAEEWLLLDGTVIGGTGTPPHHTSH